MKVEQIHSTTLQCKVKVEQIHSTITLQYKVKVEQIHLPITIQCKVKYPVQGFKGRQFTYLDCW